MFNDRKLKYIYILQINFQDGTKTYMSTQTEDLKWGHMPKHKLKQHIFKTNTTLKIIGVGFT